MIKLFFVSILFFLVLDAKDNYLDIAQLGYEQYQDIFINGQVVQRATHNHKDCDIRYQIINSILSKYSRPFTMLDIGAAQGYYSFRAAFSYPKSAFVMIEGNNEHYPFVGSQLFDLCQANTSLNNIMMLNKALTIQHARRLSECEHFDVVLALNIIHWFGESWKEIVDIILNMGSNIIIETPPQEAIISDKSNQHRYEIENYLLSKNALVIGEVHRHTSDVSAKIYLIPAHKGFLERKTWLIPLMKEKTHLIEADFDKKSLFKKLNYPADTYQKNDWIPGINLVTFKMYNGTYPTSAMLKCLLADARDESHNDWMINNMILQGNKLQLVDFNDPTHNPGGPGGGYNASIQELYDNHRMLMDITDPIKIEHCFWNYLIRLPITNKARNKFVRSLIKKDDLVFEIGSAEDITINAQLYASHHAKVISVESDVENLDILHRFFDYNDQIIIIPKQLTDNVECSDNQVTLKELIDLYGVPAYCAFNIEDSEFIILQIKEPFKCISFPFTMTNVGALERCVRHLASLGYQYFDFSCRQIPLYMLADWEGAEAMPDKIKECAQKDHEGSSLCGFVYARMENVTEA